MGRMGTNRHTGKTRRPVVWWFTCNACGAQLDFLAVKGRPDLGAPEPVCLLCSQPMRNRGLFFLRITDGKRFYEDAPKLRKEWDRLREQLLRGKLCTCGHWRGTQHRPMPPHGCQLCACAAFTEQRGTRVQDYSPPGEEVPF